MTKNEVENSTRDDGQRKVNSHRGLEAETRMLNRIQSEEYLEEEGRALTQGEQQVWRPWGESELALFFLQQKHSGWSTMSTDEWGDQGRGERSHVTYNYVLSRGDLDCVSTDMCFTLTVGTELSALYTFSLLIFTQNIWNRWGNWPRTCLIIDPILTLCHRLYFFLDLGSDFMASREW